MIDLDIPGRGRIVLRHLVMDVNGTLATDGKLLPEVPPRLAQLRDHFEIHILTADTYGTQTTIDTALGIKAHVIRSGEEKAQYVRGLGADTVVAIGNGANDAPMCTLAAVGIAVLGEEGAATALLHAADIVVRNIGEALDLLIYPLRLKATLRT